MTGYPEVAANERQSLEQFLDFHRAGVRRTLDEITDTEAAARVLPATELMIEETAQHRGHIDLLMDAIAQARPRRYA